MSAIEIIEIVGVSLSIIASIFTIVQLIVSLKKNKKTEQKSNQQTLQINGDNNNNNIINIGTITADNHVDNSSSITKNYNINKVENNINIDMNKANEQENDAFITILFMLVGMFISVMVFAYLHLCFFSVMITFIALYTCKNIFYIKQCRDIKDGIMANKCKVIIFVISIVCCIFYWLPLSSPPNYPEDVFNFVKNISTENIGEIKNFWASFCLAVFQFIGSLIFIFSYTVPYINSAYNKLKKKFNLKKETFFKYNDKIHIIFLTFSLFALSGIPYMLFKVIDFK